MARTPAIRYNDAVGHKTKNSFANAPGSSAAERMWKEITAHLTELDQLPADDPRVIEMVGAMHRLAGPPPDALLRPVDIAFLAIGEKVDILGKRFLRPGPLNNRQPEEDVLERVALGLTMSLHSEIMDLAQLRAKEDANRGTRLEADAILYHYRLWIVHARDPAIEALRTCTPSRRAWVKRLMRGQARAHDRATRLAQVSLLSFRKSGLLGSPDKMLRAIQKALRMHEAYKPKILRDGKEMLGSNKLVGAAGLSLALETNMGFANFVWLDKDHELVPSIMQAKDGFDELQGRWHEEKAEPSVGSMDQPAQTIEDGETPSLHAQIGDHRSPEPGVQVELSAAHDAVGSLDLGGLLKEILDGIDTVVHTNPDSACAMAADLVRLVDLLRNEPDPAIRAGILYAWGRGDQYRGGLDPKAIAEAMGVSVKTVRRREGDGRSRLVATGLGDPEENRSD